VGHQGNRDEIKSFLEFNKNESTTYQKLWDTGKASLKTEKDLK
jgi:hypothetical protein